MQATMQECFVPKTKRGDLITKAIIQLYIPDFYKIEEII